MPSARIGLLAPITEDYFPGHTPIMLSKALEDKLYEGNAASRWKTICWKIYCLMTPSSTFPAHAAIAIYLDTLLTKLAVDYVDGVVTIKLRDE